MSSSKWEVFNTLIVSQSTVKKPHHWSTNASSGRLGIWTVQIYSCSLCNGAMIGRHCCLRQKWVMEEHLRGLLWNSKKSFAGNWISNDAKWNWSCESVLHALWILQPQRDTEATHECSKDRTYGNEWHQVRITFHCALLNFTAAWWGPGPLDTIWFLYSLGRSSFNRERRNI